MNDLLTKTIEFKTASLRKRVLDRFAGKDRPVIDTQKADAVAAKAERRYEANKKTFQDAKRLGLKDSDKYGKAFQKLVDAGEQAAKDSREMLDQYSNVGESYTGRAKRDREVILEWTAATIQTWNRYKNDFGGSSEDRLANIYAGVQQMEANLRALPEFLKGNRNVQLDESWRTH